MFTKNDSVLNGLLDTVIAFPSESMDPHVSIQDWTSAWALCFIPLGKYIQEKGYLSDLRSVTAVSKMDASANTAYRLAAEIGADGTSSPKFVHLGIMLYEVLKGGQRSALEFANSLRFIAGRLEDPVYRMY
jgi:hypothetical protein